MRPVVALSALRGVHAGEALVMAEVEIGLRAVIGDEHLAVLVRAHRARIDVQIGVELAQPHAIAARLQQRAERRRGDAFAQGGNHAAGDEDKPRHGRPVYAKPNRGAGSTVADVRQCVAVSLLTRPSWSAARPAWPAARRRRRAAGAGG